MNALVPLQIVVSIEALRALVAFKWPLGLRLMVRAGVVMGHHSWVSV